MVGVEESRKNYEKNKRPIVYNKPNMKKLSDSKYKEDFKRDIRKYNQKYYNLSSIS